MMKKTLIAAAVAAGLGVAGQANAATVYLVATWDAEPNSTKYEYTFSPAYDDVAPGTGSDWTTWGPAAETSPAGATTAWRAIDTVEDAAKVMGVRVQGFNDIGVGSADYAYAGPTSIPGAPGTIIGLSISVDATQPGL